MSLLFASMDDLEAAKALLEWRHTPARLAFNAKFFAYDYVEALGPEIGPLLKEYCLPGVRNAKEKKFLERAIKLANKVAEKEVVTS